MRWMFLLCSMACASENSQLPPPPALTLTLDALAVGSPASVRVQGTAPGAPVRLYGSPRDVGPAYCPADLRGFCTDLARPGSLLASGTADPSGTASLTLSVPSTALRTGWLQAVSYDGAARVSPVERVDLFDCGDGIHDLPEDCDDANTIDGDRCSNRCLSATPILASPGPELKLLFVGNSYTSRNNLRTVVAQLARELGIFTSVVTAARTSGGRQLPQHAAELASGGQLATLLASNDWDAVILQEQSQIPGFPAGDASLVAFEAAVGDLDHAIEAAGAETALFMTWGRRDGDSLNPGLYPDYETMQERLQAGYYQAAARASRPDRRVHVMPAGEAWTVVHDRDPAMFNSLYAGDGSHPTYDGTYLTALVMLNRLLGTDLTGLDVLRDASGQPRAPLQLHADAAMVGL